MVFKKFLYIIIWIVFCFGFSTKAQIIIKKDTFTTALVKNTLIGNGIAISSLSITGNLNSIGYFDASNTNLGIDKGIIISTGDILNALGPNDNTRAGNSNNLGGFPILKSLSNDTLYDASAITIRFFPASDTTTFRFVFASEEYPESVGSKFNDVFGFFVSGQGYIGYENIAVIPGTVTPISINSVNQIVNSNYYRTNTGNDFQFDGYTVPIEIKIKTIPCNAYTLIMAISDVKDFLFDSGIFLEENSLKSQMDGSAYLKLSNYDPNKTIAIEGCDSAVLTIDRSGNIDQPADFEITYEGNAENGIDFIAPTTIHFNAFEKLKKVTIQILEDGVKDSIEYFYAKTIFSNICNKALLVDSIYISDYKPVVMKKISYFECDGDSSKRIIQMEGGSGNTVFTWVLETGDTVGSRSISEWLRLDTPTRVFISCLDLCNNNLVIDTFLLNPSKPGVLIGNIIKDTVDLCFMDKVQFQITSNIPNAKYKWSPKAYFDNDSIENPIFTAYSKFDIAINCRLLNEDYCVNNYTVLMRVNNMFVTEDENTICIGDSVSFKATGGSTYEWFPKTNITNPFSATPTFYPDTTKKYFVEITDENGCSSIDSIKIIVNHPPEFIHDTTTYYTCAEDRTTIQIESNCNNCTGYIWSPANSINNPFDAKPLATPYETTTYYVKMFNGTCFDFDSVQVKVIPNGNANINILVDSCSKTIFLENNSTGIYKDSINFGDDFIFKEFQSTHQYQGNGPFQLTYKVNPNTPCESIKTATIQFNDIDINERFIPNVISPDGDGKNDLFKIVGGNTFCNVNAIYIYNRWGTLLFTSENTDLHEWDAKVNGETVPAGTYFYVVKGNGFNENGSLTVIY